VNQGQTLFSQIIIYIPKVRYKFDRFKGFLDTSRLIVTLENRNTSVEIISHHNNQRTIIGESDNLRG